MYRFRMRTATLPPRADRRVAVNVSLPADLVARARARKLNLSRLLEERLRALEAEGAGDAFADENRDAVAAYNARIRGEGAFGDELRRF